MKFARRGLKVLAVAVHMCGLALLLVFGAPMLLAMHPGYARFTQRVNQEVNYSDGNQVRVMTS